MLVLSRNRDETIMIGDEVEITIVDIRGDRVRLGINAPRAVQVHRKEVYDAIKRENAEAAMLQAGDLSSLGVPVTPPIRLTSCDDHDQPSGNHHRDPHPRPARARNPRRVAS